ncbi:high choriolytic enzyme 1-like [Mugil cephalus]|uniref:high choriolytic enzyme 1-like n=1 Tax=Mugil cephalus TaxID=48193 RepID=UPI001FB6EC64|nr:high choriolytic enzyme 1-like [Mugil cephalus]
MTLLKCTLSLLVLLVVSDRCWAAEQDLPVSELLWRANKDVVHTEEEPIVVDDIAYDNENERNADQCTSRGCMWGKSNDGKVYVPYVIADIIQHCYSYVGRRGNSQTLSLDRQGCVYHSTVQHELLHALGFNHEQCRSDRDQHIRILWENIQSGLAYAFDKMNTLNMDTPYDYNSVMQYHRYAFSGNNKPTMVPIPNANVEFGKATQMSKNDITRLNRLYKC